MFNAEAVYDMVCIDSDNNRFVLINQADVVNRQTFLGIAQQRMSLDIYGRGFVEVRVSVLHSYDNLLPVTTINMCGAKHYYRRRWNGS